MGSKTVFISYRRDAAGKALARSLKEELTHRGYDAFLDVDCVDAGLWEQQIISEVPKRAHYLLVLTPSALDRCTDPKDWVRREFLDAVKYGRNIVPIREESVNLNQMRDACDPSMKPVFAYQIADLRHGSFTSDLDTLVTRFIPPHMTPSDRKTAADAPLIDISRIDKYAPAELIGREDEIKLLNDAWAQAVAGEADRPRVLTFVALGGEGKTSLVAKWLADELLAQGWPGCEAAFAWSFYSQGAREQTAADSDAFLREALIFFGDPQTANSALHASEKARKLAPLVAQRRALLILDGLEPLQYPPDPPHDGRLKDDGVARLLKGLAASSRGLCVVTTRYSIPDLKAYRNSAAPEHELKRLSKDAGVELLKKLGVKGVQAEFEKLVEDVDGHALTLEIMGGYLKRAFNGDIRKRDRVKFEKADATILGGHAFRAMGAYVKWLEADSDAARRELAVLSLMGLFDRPASADCVAALRSEAIEGLTESLVGLAEEDWNLTLAALETAKLLTVNRNRSDVLLSLDAHPLIREYFAKWLREDKPEVWRAAHRRLYEHLCGTTSDTKPKPTLEDLQPLYQAVAHGCHAGLQQQTLDDVYLARILHGTDANGFYSTTKLGAFGSDLGAVACFFEEPWRRVSTALKEEAWLLNEAAYQLRALGRLTEALEPMRAGLEMRVKQGGLKEAATNAGNLSELELTLGNLSDALRDAEQSVTYADRSEDAFEKMSDRTTHADALFQAGRREEAEARFREAEQMQAESEPEYPLLYSLPGFRYCDLLLADVEREVWRMQNDECRMQKDQHLLACGTVNERAVRAIQIASRYNWLLDIALDHLTLGRVALYRAILEGSDFTSPASDLSHIEAAVDGLRRAGQQDDLPRGLLTRAWLRTRMGDADGARDDLDEAWEIAERGPMRLHMADILLHRARLFFRVQPYPWASDPDHPDAPPRTAADDLRAARALIEKCGYWRRKDELEDAEAVILGKAK